MGWSRTNALDEIKTLTSYDRHHRLLLLDRISPQDPVSEIEYIHGSLLPDPKNYHTWAYLHWLYSHFSTLGRISEAQWGSELDWCNEMLRVDGRNNSAWGWRWYLRVSRPGAETSSSSLQDELMWVVMLVNSKIDIVVKLYLEVNSPHSTQRICVELPPWFSQALLIATCAHPSSYSTIHRLQAEPRYWNCRGIWFSYAFGSAARGYSVACPSGPRISCRLFYRTE